MRTRTQTQAQTHALTPASAHPRKQIQISEYTRAFASTKQHVSSEVLEDIRALPQTHAHNQIADLKEWRNKVLFGN